MKPKVIFEDEHLLILDKPAGWVVNDVETTKHQKVVQKWLSKMTYSLAKSSVMRSGIVHRLDKETSGVLVVAKKEIAFKNLQDQFKARRVKKEYTALVHGKVEPQLDSSASNGAWGIIKAPVGRLPWNRERFGVLPGGRSAETKYKVLGYYEREEVRPLQVHSLLELKPKTGRTHQIRIHLKHLGHPIVSDEFYAGRKTARADRKWCPRLFLHAKEISFTHPKTGKRVSFSADMPADLEAAINALKPKV